MSEKQIAIVPMTQVHVPDVVAAHIASFPEAFLTFLGQRFLTVLYGGAITSPYGLGVVAVDQENREQTVAGFAVGMLNPAAFYRGLLREQGWRFAWAALHGVARRPQIIARLLRARRYPAETPRDERTVTLGSIGVRPEYRRCGLGSRLVQGFLELAQVRGARQVNLTTDAANNEAVNAFYGRLGFICTHSFCTPEGRYMQEYQIDLRP